MAQAREDDPEWVLNLRQGGKVPFQEDAENCSEGWSAPSGDIFSVRGPDYLTTKVKIPAGDWLLRPLALDWVKSSSKIHDILTYPNSRVREALAMAENGVEGESSLPFVWAFNLQIPSKDNHSLVAYFVSFDPVEEGSVIARFIDGDDGFRNGRLKLIANVVKGPWIVRAAVGEQAICILGKAVVCKYTRARRFLEVDVDIGASIMANAIVHLALGYITSLSVDLAFVIEAQTEGELPERILGATRFANLDPGKAVTIEPPPLTDIFADADFADAVDEASLTSRFWKSVNTLLHPTQADGQPDKKDGSFQ